MDAQVRPEKMKALQEQMERLGIFEKDLIEKFVRSGGKGGQKVNKASSCVYLKHLPTGIEVKCQQERYQSLNRFQARRLLTDKIETLARGKLSREEQEREKIRRQKRRRSRRAKARMLEDKHIQAGKKFLRSKDFSLDE
jgi:protein subunit release factor B